MSLFNVICLFVVAAAAAAAAANDDDDNDDDNNDDVSPRVLRLHLICIKRQLYHLRERRSLILKPACPSFNRMHSTAPTRSRSLPLRFSSISCTNNNNSSSSNNNSNNNNSSNKQTA